jgi:NitT/TauT family transport system substrate-binding protein
MHTNRRDLLVAGCCGASTALFWSVAARLRAQGLNPPETATIRLAKNPTICIAPQYVRPAECRGVHKRRLRSI